LVEKLRGITEHIGINKIFSGVIQNTIVKEVAQDFQIPCIELEIHKRFRVPVNDNLLNTLETWLKEEVLSKM